MEKKSELNQKSWNTCFHKNFRPFTKEKGNVFLYCGYCNKIQQYCKNCNIPCCINCFDIIVLPIPPNIENNESLTQDNLKDYENDFQNWYKEKLQTKEFEDLKKRGLWVSYWKENSKEYYENGSIHNELRSNSFKMKVGETKKVLIVVKQSKERKSSIYIDFWNQKLINDQL